MVCKKKVITLKGVEIYSGIAHKWQSALEELYTDRIEKFILLFIIHLQICVACRSNQANFSFHAVQFHPAVMGKNATKILTSCGCL